MLGDTHRYPIVIKEVNLDVYAHVNNATYLTFFEEARWEIITSHGYGYKQIMKHGQGPIILETTIKYLKELTLRDEIVIETNFLSYEKKIAKLVQRMMRGEEICCVAEFTFGLFDVKERKLVLPTPEWLRALGLESFS